MTIKNKIKLIYNPNAGKKRALLKSVVDLEDIEMLLKQYQLEVDFYPTKRAGHASILAKEAIKEKYSIVLAAGGDGTVSEVANGLIGSDITMGILPLGTFMNIAKMLSISTNLETAVALIKIGRTRKIDVGSVTKIDGSKLDVPYYFLETAGIGLDAELQETFKDFEAGNVLSLVKIVKNYFSFYSTPVRLMVDDVEQKITSSLLTISNGPYTGATLMVAPNSKLNDHKLTLSIYKMSKIELISHFLKIKIGKPINTHKIKTIQADSIKILSVGRHVHADASLFGLTPVSFKVIPNALDVICGFPAPDEVTALKKRTPLDP